MYALILTLIAVASALDLPPIFQKCNRSQPDFKECVLKAARNGIPKMAQPITELNLPAINPFFVEKLTVGAGQGPVAVDQHFENCKLFGFTNVKLNQFEFNFEKKSLDLDAVIPDLRKLCQYELDGKVLLLPIKGKGPSTVSFKNIKVLIHFDYEEIKKRNKTFLKFVSSKVTRLDPELVHFNFENLLVSENSGDDLGKSINQVLNDNWEDVFGDVKSGYIQVVEQILLSIINSFFAKVSLEEAFD